MTPIELLARREALGLSQRSLADWLGVAQNTVSNWELGKRSIPEGITGEMIELEDRVDDLADRMLEAVDAVGEQAALITYASDAALHAAHPELDGWPSALHRVACARAAAAARDEGWDVPIVDGMG